MQNEQKANRGTEDVLQRRCGVLKEKHQRERGSLNSFPKILSLIEKWEFPLLRLYTNMSDSVMIVSQNHLKEWEYLPEKNMIFTFFVLFSTTDSEA